MARRLGYFAYRRRWAIICGWLVVFSVSAVFAPRITSVLKGGGYSTPSTQSDRAFNAIEKTYGDLALAFTAVFESSSGTPSSRTIDAATRFRSELQARFGGRVVDGPPLFSPDRRIVFVRIFTRPRSDLGIPLTARVRPLLPQTNGVRAYLTGASAIFYDMEKVSDADLQRMEIITFPIALAILLIIFGTVLGAFVPVSMGPLTVTAALASIFLLGHTIDMSIFVLNTASMLGLGVAIDYSLFMVQRFREELRRTSDVQESVACTVSTSGRAIFISALTVAIGFLGMTFFRVTMLTSLGIGGSVVVAISLVAALTLLPAILSVLGDKVNALAVVPQSLNSRDFWPRLAAFVMKRPWPVIAFVVCVVAIMAFPAGGLHVGVPGPDILPRSSTSRVGDSLLRQHIGIADQSPVLLVLQSPTRFQAAATRIGLLQLAGRICRNPIVAGVSPSPVVNSGKSVVPCRVALRRAASPLQFSAKAPSTILIAIFMRADPSSARAESFIEYLRGSVRPPGVSILVGGQTAAQLDFDRFLYGQLPWAILFVVLSIFVILAVSFHSLLLPIKAVIMNGFSVLAAYGTTVFVFQDGALQQVFGFTPTGSLDSIVPIFIFCVLFGLSTDYEVFLLARVREEYARTLDNTHSVSRGLERTGRMITSAALIMVVIFGAFSFANLVVIKELGFAMAVGVLVDATLIRALLVPAAMRILGVWNWWPGRYEASVSDAAVVQSEPGPSLDLVAGGATGRG